jgi:hypothetical protein
MKQIALATLVGALVSFTWGFISWMQLSWHRDEMKSFTNEAAVAEVIRANTPAPGQYILPGNPSLPKNADLAERDTAEKAHQRALTQGPFLYATVRPQAKIVDMNTSMIYSFVRSLCAALVLSILLSMTSRLDYIQRLGFCALVGLFVGIAAEAQQYVWFEAPLRFTLVNVLDYVAEWFVAGLAIAGIVVGRDNL